MAPRATWKGHLRLSLVSCPVRLYNATSSKDRITFNQLHKDTHNRINMKPVDPELGLVERSDLVKGYEYEDKKYIIIDSDDLDNVKIESNHTISIEAFVDEGEIDPLYLDAPYYLAPDGAMAEETFVVLREALKKAGKVAIARLVLSSRERVITRWRTASDSAASPCISPSTSMPGASSSSKASALRIFVALGPSCEPKLECERSATFGSMPKRRT